MNDSQKQGNDNRAAVFGLTKAQLLPIVESIAGEAVASFDVRIDSGAAGSVPDLPARIERMHFTGRPAGKVPVRMCIDDA